MEIRSYTFIESPVGRLFLGEIEGKLTDLLFMPGKKQTLHGPEWRESETPFKETIRQLRAYFGGELKRFDVPLSLKGTPFQLAAWKELMNIPYGETITYGEQAGRMGRPKACRAVGGANGRNPVAIIVPCHRVVAANGKIGGFGGGLGIKRKLLALENVPGW